MSFDPETCHSESDVETKFITGYLLPELGYDSENWYQQRSRGKKRIDFIVTEDPADKDEDAFLVIEAKKPTEKLNKHIKQLEGYLKEVKAQYGILTNGNELRVYRHREDGLITTFHCSGYDVDKHIDRLKGIVGFAALKQRKEHSQKGYSMKRIAIYHNKGGVGKTTVCVNLAATLRHMGYRVLLVDLDSQANASYAVGLYNGSKGQEPISEDNCVLALLLDKGRRESFTVNDIRCSSVGFNVGHEIDVLPSHISLIEEKSDVAGSSRVLAILNKRLDEVDDQYDFVIIDTPPSLDVYAKIALFTADYLIIPSDLRAFSNQALPILKNFIKKEINESRDMLMRKDEINILGILPSKINTSKGFIDNVLPVQRKYISKTYKLPVMDGVIFNREDLGKASSELIEGTGTQMPIPNPKSIIAYAASSRSKPKSVGEFKSLAKEVIEKTGALEPVLEK